MRCFVINLKRAVERRQNVSVQLNQLRLPFEIIEGVDWKYLDESHLPETIKHIKIKNSFRTLTLGQIGCNLSHRNVLNWLVNSSEKMIAVLEDDVRLSNDFHEVLNTLEISTHDFDIVFLGSRFKEQQLVNLIPLNEKFSFSLSRAREKGAWGYVITKEAAKEFLNILPKITGPIDDALHAYFLHELKTYTLNPQIVFHAEIGKIYSYNTETKMVGISFKDELMRLVSLFFELYFHKIHFRKRIKSEKLH